MRTVSPPLSPEKIEQCLIRVRANWPYDELAILYGVSQERIGQIARRNGIYRRKHRTKNGIARIKLATPDILQDLLDQRKSYTDIAWKWKISKTKLSRIARAHNLGRFVGQRSIDI